MNKITNKEMSSTRIYLQNIVKENLKIIIKLSTCYYRLVHWKETTYYIIFKQWFITRKFL